MKLNADQRRALELLADSPCGHTETPLLAHEIEAETLADLVRNGFATVAAETIQAGDHAIEVARFGITDAGREGDRMPSAE